MKILMISGLGRLHFPLISSVIKNHSSFDIGYITGAIPNKYIAKIIFYIAGKFIYKYQPSVKSIDLRIPKYFRKNDVIDLKLPDFFLFILLMLSKFKMCSENRAYSLAYSLFGILSAKYVNKHDLIYVRAGTGFRLIDKAKKNKKFVIVDYSSAHPNDIVNSLISSKSDNAIKLYYKRKNLWDMAINDIQKSDLVTVNSKYVKESLVKNGIDKNKIFINNIPINIELLPFKTDYSLKKNIDLAFSGRFVSWKGADIIIDVLADLIKIYKNTKLYIYGVVDPIFYKSTKFQKLKKNNNIIEYGFIKQEELFLSLKEKDIYIFLSYSEGSAQSVKEAMAIGLPVICSKSSGSPIINNKNGLITEIDKKSCIKAVLDLVHNENKRINLGKSARREIKNNHNETQFVNTFMFNLKKKIEI